MTEVLGEGSTGPGLWQKLYVRTVEKSAKYRSCQPKEGRCTAGSAYPSTGNPGTRTLIFLQRFFSLWLLTRWCVVVFLARSHGSWII